MLHLRAPAIHSTRRGSRTSFRFGLHSRFNSRLITSLFQTKSCAPSGRHIGNQHSVVGFQGWSPSGKIATAATSSGNSTFIIPEVDRQAQTGCRYRMRDHAPNADSTPSAAPTTGPAPPIRTAPPAAGPSHQLWISDWRLLALVSHKDAPDCNGFSCDVLDLRNERREYGPSLILRPSSYSAPRSHSSPG